MPSQRHPMLLGMVCACLAACAHTTYPPAFPADLEVPWATNKMARQVLESRLTCPPWHPWHPLLSMIPVGEDWSLWETVRPAKQVCTGKGKARKCRPIKEDAVTQANQGALVRATPAHTKAGLSAQTRYPLDTWRAAIYEIVTSPDEATYVIMPEGERLSMRLVVNPYQWEVAYGESKGDTRTESMVVKPVTAPLVARGMLVFQSGLRLHLKLVARKQPGMLSVSWDLPPQPPPPPPPQVLPPEFNKDRAYANYTLELDGKQKPPWYPVGAVDDGKNTMIKFPTQFDGIRMPVVQGIQQNGSPALVQSRLYQRPEHGAWLYVQGLWPALSVRDAAGITVKVVRHTPRTLTLEERTYGY